MSKFMQSLSFIDGFFITFAIRRLSNLWLVYLTDHPGISYHTIKVMSYTTLNSCQTQHCLKQTFIAMLSMVICISIDCLSVTYFDIIIDVFKN